MTRSRTRSKSPRSRKSSRRRSSSRTHLKKGRFRSTERSRSHKSSKYRHRSESENQSDSSSSRYKSSSKHKSHRRSTQKRRHRRSSTSSSSSSSDNSRSSSNRSSSSSGKLHKNKPSSTYADKIRLLRTPSPPKMTFSSAMDYLDGRQGNTDAIDEINADGFAPKTFNSATNTSSKANKTELDLKVKGDPKINKFDLNDDPLFHKNVNIISNYSNH